jgi:hypothetical protein
MGKCEKTVSASLLMLAGFCRIQQDPHSTRATFNKIHIQQDPHSTRPASLMASQFKRYRISPQAGLPVQGAS